MKQRASRIGATEELRQVAEYYDSLSVEQILEDSVGVEDGEYCRISVPKALLPDVRRMIAQYLDELAAPKKKARRGA